MKSRIQTLLAEVVDRKIITPSTVPDTMSFWHGGNLDEFNDIISQKNGRYEHGPGLYLTTHYGTATRYAKGGRKLYLVTVQKGTDIRNSVIEMDRITEFVNMFVIKNKRSEILKRMIEWEDNGKIPAYVFGNNILNSNAIKATNTKHLREFYIDNHIDYEMVSSPFGWGEMMMVLYNMRKIVDTKIVKSTDKIEMFDLPTTWAE